jgi:hypothetical protein
MLNEQNSPYQHTPTFTESLIRILKVSESNYEVMHTDEGLQDLSAPEGEINP